MKKKVFAIIMAALLVVLGTALVACNNDKDDTDTSSTNPVDEYPNGKLVVGFDAGFPPMGFSDGEGGYTGFDLEFAAAVAEHLGRELVLKPIEWANNETELNGGNIDCLWNGMTINEDRLEAFEISRAYMKNEQVVIVRADDDYTTFADLAGKKAGLQAGSTAYNALEKNEEFKNSLDQTLVMKENNTMVATDLESGVIECAIMDSIVANYMISQGQDFRVLEEVLEDEEFGIGFAKGNTALRDEVQNAIYELYADGTLTALSEKWFADDVLINTSAEDVDDVENTEDVEDTEDAA